jgi:hypothetical protein
MVVTFNGRRCTEDLGPVLLFKHKNGNDLIKKVPDLGIGNQSFFKSFHGAAPDRYISNGLEALHHFLPGIGRNEAGYHFARKIKFGGDGGIPVGIHGPHNARFDPDEILHRFSLPG